MKRRHEPTRAPCHATGAPFRLFILKLTGFCNLNCSYCYMFNSRDRSHEAKPRHMNVDIAIASLRAIETHLSRWDAKSASISLHGGEPTLWPIESFRALFAEIARLRRAGFVLDVSMQTNLWQRPKIELLDLCETHDVGLGISLDGPRTANDANRVDFAGRGSHDRILANARWMIDAGYGDLIGGFLCVMQPSIRPKDFLAWLASLPVTYVDLLWPIEFNRANPPWADGGEARYVANPRFGAWAEDVFEEWWRIDRPELGIRLFNDAIQAELGAIRSTDVLGALSFGSLVIATDGAIELADYFRTSKDGGCHTGYSIPADDFDTLANDVRFRKLRRAAETVPGPCRSCAHSEFCRGGALSGRLDAQGGLTDTPSVLCHDHMRLFDRIAARVEGERLAS